MSLWDKIRKPALLAFAVFVFGCVPLLAEADRPIEVGIPTTKFNFVSATQMQTEWCWAASVQMVLNWYDIPIKQSQVVKRIYGKTVDEAASENAIAVAMNGTAVDRKGRKVVLRTVRYTGIPSTNLLVSEMQQQHPMLITFRSSKTMLHAVVLTSAEYTQTEQGIHVTSLTFRDPNPTFHDRYEAGAIRITGEKLTEFVKAISSYYLVSRKY
ncbi:MAG TPA: papain-like cysteine protease family protein [Candidatus Koribacter sp.]|jgi:hypothetical protein